jgi:hypothetical protein
MVGEPVSTPVPVAVRTVVDTSIRNGADHSTEWRPIGPDLRVHPSEGGAVPWSPNGTGTVTGMASENGRADRQKGDGTGVVRVEDVTGLP